jgi:hypothetical protein
LLFGVLATVGCLRFGGRCLHEERLTFDDEFGLECGLEVGVFVSVTFDEFFLLTGSAAAAEETPD